MKGTMKAARLHEIKGPYRIDTVPIPQIGANDVLIKVMACVPNGGDRHVQSGDIIPGTLPMTVNHQCVGVIEEVGPEVKTFKKGDRVAADPQIGCREAACHYCQGGLDFYCPHGGYPGMRTFDFATDIGAKLWAPYADGGMAEYWKVPAYFCTIIPDKIPFDEAANLAIAVSYRAVVRSEIEPGDTVILDSCTGASGSPAIKIALLWDPGMVIVIGRTEKKLKQIKSWAPNIIQTISSTKEKVQERIMQLTGGRGADRLIDFTPTGSVNIAEQCLQSLRVCGKAVFVGGCAQNINVPYTLFTYRGIELTGSICFRRDDLEVCYRLMSQGKLDFKDTITHRFPLTKANEAMEVFNKRTGDPMVIVVLPQEA